MKRESGIPTTKGSPIYPAVARAITKLGHDISLARRIRRIPAEEFATQMGISRATLYRLENGDPGVSLNTLAMALFALGRLDLLSNLVDQPKDEVGLMLMRQDVPKRISRRRGVLSQSALDTDESEPVPTDKGYVGW
ncbi:transcriptional regulator with XRE-family HTH domain [Bosea sp. BE125]|uniref:helix-turn-helix domain-containing protein n=1 Tax=Bosea sp. BE125 TaxID=2817909 RepID=UPI00285F7102|nr:helix-turn-helix transcriptional regulator [Bosea sp. BE125]MDR6872251.1 transcriptional regulator with XRE-family HTH domain [Bosea sp. BE125]